MISASVHILIIIFVYFRDNIVIFVVIVIINAIGFAASFVFRIPTEIAIYIRAIILNIILILSFIYTKADAEA